MVHARVGLRSEGSFPQRVRSKLKALSSLKLPPSFTANHSTVSYRRAMFASTQHLHSSSVPLQQYHTYHSDSIIHTTPAVSYIPLRQYHTYHSGSVIHTTPTVSYIPLQQYCSQMLINNYHYY
jgi:hypothetical protein